MAIENLINITTPWTPAHHVSVNKIKPVRLLEIGEGPHGKTARMEFSEGWVRTIDLTCEADAWHPLFSELSIEDARQLHECVKHPVVRHADGKRTQRGELSFFTTELSRMGNGTAWNYFDVPAEEYSAGWVAGYKCAAELLDALNRGYGPHIDVRYVIKDAIHAGGDPSGKPGRRGASGAFMEIMVEAITFMSKHGRNEPWLARKIERAEKQRDYWAEREAVMRAEFAIRMKTARQAKRMEQIEMA